MQDDFVPIEVRVPNWIDGRRALEAVLPERLSFVQVDENLVKLDWSWCESLIESIPKDSVDAAVSMMQETCNTIVQIIPVERFARFKHHPLNPTLISLMTAELALYEQEAIEIGNPSFNEVIAHTMGLRMSLPILAWQLSAKREGHIWSN